MSNVTLNSPRPGPQPDWLKLDRVSRPIFVVGPPRSGSSLLESALQVAGIPGFREGHLFPLLSTLIEQATHYYNAMEARRMGQDIGIGNLPRVVLLSRLVDIFEELYLQRFQSPVWHDKTVNVEMVQSVGMLADLWPRARFIFCTRDAASCIESGLRQFGDGADFAAACRQWAGCHFEWRKQRDWLATRSFELRQNELLGDPEAVSHALGEFLDLSPERHAAFCTYLRTKIAQFLRDRAETPAGFRSYDDFTMPERRVFLQTCGQELMEFGYWPAEELTRRRAEDGSLALEYTTSRARVDTSRLADPQSFAPLPGGFLLHPPPPGSNAAIVFRKVRIETRRRFTARASIENDRATEAVVFGAAIEVEGVQIASQQRTVSPGEAVEFDIRFETDAATVDVVLMTEMEPDAPNNYFSWAKWGGACVS